MENSLFSSGKLYEISVSSCKIPQSVVYCIQIRKVCFIIMENKPKNSFFKRGQKTELTIEEQARRSRIRDRYCWIFVLTVAVWVLRFALGGLASIAAGSLTYYPAAALTALANALAVFLPFFAYQRVSREPLMPVFREEARSEHPVIRTLIGVVSVSGLTLGAMGLTDLLLSVAEMKGLHSAITVPAFGTTPAQSIFYVAVTAVFSSFAYEIAYRGIALRSMREENRIAAVLVSGVAYALSDGEPYLLVVRLAIGFVIGFFYLRVRSVWSCIVLQAASQITVSLWWIFAQYDNFLAYANYLIFMGLVLGVAAAFFLFFPRRDPDGQEFKNSVALKQIFTSFGIYLLVGLVAFNMLMFTFSTDADPADPLLQPIDDDDKIPPLHFDRDQEFQDYYGTLDPDIDE